MAVGFDAGVGFDAAVNFDGTQQFTPADLRVELFYTVGTGKLWVDITDDVRVNDGVQLARGRTGEATTATPGTCSLTLDNRTGLYSPRNASGALYGLIGRNTPLRVGFGNPVLGAAAVQGAGGTTITLPQVPTFYGPVGVHALSLALPTGDITPPAGYTQLSENDGTLFTVETYRTTDSGVVPSTTATHSTTLTAGGGAQLAVPGGTYSSSLTAIANAGATVPSIDYSSAQTGMLATAICMWTSDQYDRMQPPRFDTQRSAEEMYLVADTGPSTGPRIMCWAWWQKADNTNGVGLVGLDGAGDGVTGASLSVAWWTGADRYTARFTGEISEWPVAWTKAGGEVVAPLTAGGALRRAGQNRDITSPLYNALTNRAEVAHYWPMEDMPGSTRFAPAIGGVDMGVVNTVSLSDVTSMAGSKPLGDFTGGGAVSSSLPNSFGDTWGVGAVMSIPLLGTAVGTNLVSGLAGGSGSTISAYWVEYTTSTSLELKWSSSLGVVTSLGVMPMASIFPSGLLGRQVMIYMYAKQNGADVDFYCQLWNLTPGESFLTNAFTQSAVAQTLGPLSAMSVGVEGGGVSTLGTNGISFGHAFATTGTALLNSDQVAYAGRAWSGIQMSTAVRNVARDGGVKITMGNLDTWDTVKSGPVEVAAVVDNLVAMERASQAVMSDAAGFVGIEWVSLSSIVNPTSKFGVNASSAGKILTGDLGPVDDDSTTLNDSTVVSTNGPQYRSEVTTGALGVATVGRYARNETLPVFGLQGATDLASWLSHQGTYDASRWPEVTLEMCRDTTPIDWREVSIGDTFTLSGLPSYTGVSSVELVIVGFAETINAAQWQVTLVTRLTAMYDILVWDQGDWDEHNWAVS